jgi:hypothetical protein
MAVLAFAAPVSFLFFEKPSPPLQHCGNCGDFSMILALANKRAVESLQPSRRAGRVSRDSLSPMPCGEIACLLWL